MRPRSIAVGAAVVLATLLSAAGAAASAAIQIVDFGFTPSDVTVEVGETVTWTNADGFAHTVTADGGAFDSGSLDGAVDFTWDAAAVGTYPYHCAFHLSMTGLVTVVAPAASAATPGPSISTDPPTDAIGSPRVPGGPDRGAFAAVVALGALGLAWTLAGGVQRPWRVRGIGGRPRRPSTR